MQNNAFPNNNGSNGNRPRSPSSLEAGGTIDVPAAAGGFVDVRLSVAVPPSPYRSTFSAAGGATKTVGSAQNSPHAAAEGGVRIVFKVRRVWEVVSEIGYFSTTQPWRRSAFAHARIPSSSSPLFSFFDA